MGKERKPKKETKKQKNKPIQHTVERVAIPGRVPYGEKLSGDVTLAGTKVHVIGKHKVSKRDRKQIMTTVTSASIPHADEKSLRLNGISVLVKGKHRTQKEKKKGSKQSELRELPRRVEKQYQGLLTDVYAKGFQDAVTNGRVKNIKELKEKVVKDAQRGDIDDVRKNVEEFDRESESLHDTMLRRQEYVHAQKLRTAKRDLEHEIHEMKHREPGYGEKGEEGAPWERAGDRARVKAMEQYKKDLETGKDAEKPDLNKISNEAHNQWWEDYNKNEPQARKEDKEYWQTHGK